MDEQIIGILGEHEAGATFTDMCRKHGMADGTFHSWQAKFGGMTVSEIKRLKTFEEESVMRKKLLAEQMLDLCRDAGAGFKKTGDAYREALGVRTSEGHVGAFGPAALPDRRSVSEDDPLPAKTGTGNGTARHAYAMEQA